MNHGSNELEVIAWEIHGSEFSEDVKRIKKMSSLKNAFLLQTFQGKVHWFLLISNDDIRLSVHHLEERFEDVGICEHWLTIGDNYGKNDNSLAGIAGCKKANFVLMVIWCFLFYETESEVEPDNLSTWVVFLLHIRSDDNKNVRKMRIDLIGNFFFPQLFSQVMIDFLKTIVRERFKDTWFFLED